MKLLLIVTACAAALTLSAPSFARGYSSGYYGGSGYRGYSYSAPKSSSYSYGSGSTRGYRSYSAPRSGSGSYRSSNPYAGTGITKEHSVRGYTRRDGTRVQSHMRMNPNNTQYDNWTTRGNINPHTGEPGDREPLY